MLGKHVERKPKLAKLVVGQPLAQNLANPRKNRSQNRIIFEADLRENYTDNRIRLVPTHYVRFPRRPLKSGQYLEEHPSTFLSYKCFACVHQEQHKRSLSPFAPFPL